MGREKQGLSVVAAGSEVAGVSPATGRVTGGTPTEAAGNEVVAVAKRRRFAPCYKRHIVGATAACTEAGDIGSMPVRSA